MLFTVAAATSKFHVALLVNSGAEMRKLQPPAGQAELGMRRKLVFPVRVVRWSVVTSHPNWTALSMSKWPDQGLFARGLSRLYVHRGTGFYGFPLRIGVPAEHSVLEITQASSA